eukprot:4294279-Alexandrium_andersonii.AAC.1
MLRRGQREVVIGGDFNVPAGDPGWAAAVSEAGLLFAAKGGHRSSPEPIDAVLASQALAFGARPWVASGPSDHDWAQPAT